MDKIVIIRESILSMQICTTIPPEERHTINDELRNCGLSTSGTSSGWVLDETVEPVRCEDFSDRWHYICVC